MTIRVQRHAHVSKQATLLDGLDISPLKWRVCGCGLNPFVHEGINHISNVEVHSKTRSGNVNIYICTRFIEMVYLIEMVLLSTPNLRFGKKNKKNNFQLHALILMTYLCHGC